LGGPDDFRAGILPASTAKVNGSGAEVRGVRCDGVRCDGAKCGGAKCEGALLERRAVGHISQLLEVLSHMAAMVDREVADA